MCRRPARTRRRAGAWLGLLLLVFPSHVGAARPWPDTSRRIVPFADQLPNDLNATQRWFAATHFAGTQKMLQSEIRALRAYNTNFLCLHYQLGVGAGPAAFVVGDAWGSDWTYVNAQTNWFLRTTNGQRVHQTQWNWDIMDVRYTNGSPVSGFPAYWISNCLARIRAAEDDGVFADSFTPDAYGFGQSSPPHPWLEDVDLCRANWIPNLEQFGRAARAGLASNDFVFLPNLGALVTSWMNMDYGLGHGGMIEGFAFWGPDSYLDAADWALQMDRALALARSNKIVICQSYPGAASGQERMFATASYLLVKGAKTYLNLLATDDVALEYYPEYDLDLGGATGVVPASAAALWHAPWGVYRRDYSNGIVLVNPSAAAVNIPNLGATRWRAVPSGGGIVNSSGSHGGTLSAVAATNLSLPAHSGAVLFSTNPFAPPVSGPAQPTNLRAFHRSGQTFLTWSERADLAGESYRVYRHTQPIAASNLSAATRLYEVWEGSADFPANRYVDAAFQARYFDRVVITNRGAPLPAGTGLLAWTLATNDFAGGATGTAYYAVTTVSGAGAENRTNFAAGNALGPLGEGVAEPLPVETAQTIGARGRVYLQFMDLRKWNPTFHAPNPGNGYYGLNPDSPAVRHALAYVYDYAVFAPDCGTNAMPATLILHGWGGNTYGPITEDPDPWGWCTYRIYPVDQGETWWFGFARDHDFRADGEVAAGDVIVNYTEQRVLRMIRDLQRQPPGPPVDTNRIYVYGQSMGGSGTLALALRYPNVFAAAFASQPMTDYATSGDGGGIDWRDDVAAKWGARALNLPVQLDAPAGWAAPIQGRSGTGVWTWQNHRLNATNRIGDDNVPFGITHGTNDDVIEWTTQGRPVYGALDAGRRCWGGLVSDADHTWIGFEGFPPGIAPVDYAPFANFRVVRNETVPGLSRDSGDLASPPARTGGYHQNLDWSASWNAWDGVPQDTATNWQVSLRALDGRSHVVDVTPRRTQRFRPAIGAILNWRNMRVGDGVQVQSGTAVVDAAGLVTATNVAVGTAGNRVRFELAGGAATGRVFYVATNGNNAAAGSSAQPWRTPGYASRQLAPGDTLVIRGGRYVQSAFDADILAPASGRADAWITIRGEAGNRPVLAGRSNLYASVVLGGRSYLRLENLEIASDTNAAGAARYFREGINVLGEPASTNLVLDNLYIHHLDEFGVDAQDVDGLTVTNCRIEYCGFGAIGGPAGVRGGLRNLSVRNSRLAYSGHYYQGGDGSARPYDRPDGFGIEASAGPVEIVDTVSEHNHGDGLDSKAARTAIRRCVVANNSCDGIKLWDGGSRVENTLVYGRGDGDPTPTPWSLVVLANPAPSNPRFEFVNVTVADQHSGNYLLHAQYDYPAVPLDLAFRNCIFQSVDSPIFINGASTLAADHNLFHAPDRPAEVLLHGATTYGSGTMAALGTGNRYGDPLFRAPAWGTTGDFQLRSNSPAIDLGTAVDAPADDLNFQIRVAPPDAGAYEWISAPGLAVAPATQTVGAAAGTTAFAVTNPGGGTVVYAASESVSWLAISSGGSGTNGGTLAIAYDANAGAAARTGLIAVTGGGFVRTCAVVQAAASFVPRRINCGGPAIAGATPWLADTGYSGGTAKSTTSAIANVTNAPQAMYQTRRYAPTLTYVFPDVPDGTYTIRLHFAELYYGAAGRRRFNVAIEGQTQLTNFDIYQAAGGKNRAVVRTFENVAVSGGLQIQGVASVDGAQFNGIEIEAAGPPAPAIVASAAQVVVPEGGTATFGVHLDTAPAGATTVTVVRASGDADIAVSGGDVLVFTPANYAVDQTVTLAAAEDADTANGTAAIQCTAFGFTAAGVTATEQDNDAPPFSLKVNCGGSAVAGGWVADTGYSGGTAKSTTSAIANATNAPLAIYQTRRYAPTLTYSFPAVPDGTYTIRLHFAELYYGAAGRRIFNVAIEGQTRLTNFDIYQAAGGKYRAVVRTFENVAVSGGLQIQGVASVDGAQFNGIEILAEAGARKTAVQTPAARLAQRPVPDVVLSSADAQAPDAGWAAVDGDWATVWRASGNWGSWICLGYDPPVQVRAIDVHFAAGSPLGLFTLASEDAVDWFELEPELEIGPVELNYLWFLFPADLSAPPAAVREIQVLPAP